MSIHPIPAPTAMLTMVIAGTELASRVGVDLVCDPVDGQAHVLIVMPNSPCQFRLEFTREQLAALMDELCELADVADLQMPLPSQAELDLARQAYYGGSA